MFLSTDAGGTGLNLQAADTVINLELPWNPACWSSASPACIAWARSGRCAVDLLVTRGTIEERVLQVMQQKRALFAGLFAGDSDEIDFAALGQPAFLEAVREIVGEEPAAMAPDASAGRAEAGGEQRAILGSAAAKS